MAVAAPASLLETTAPEIGLVASQLGLRVRPGGAGSAEPLIHHATGEASTNEHAVGAAERMQ